MTVKHSIISWTSLPHSSPKPREYYRGGQLKDCHSQITKTTTNTAVAIMTAQLKQVSVQECSLYYSVINRQGADKNPPLPKGLSFSLVVIGELVESRQGFRGEGRKLA